MHAGSRTTARAATLASDGDPRAPRKNPVAATLGNVTRKGASRDGASGRPRPDRGPTAAITTRRVREWFNVTTPLGNRRVPGVRARSRRSVRRRARRRRCAEKPPLPVCTRAKGSGRSRASARAATGGVARRARAMFRGVFTNLERDVVDLWGEEGSRSAAGSTGQGRAMQDPRKRRRFPGGESPGAWPRARTYLDIFVRPLAEELDFSDLSHGDSCPRVLRVGRQTRPSFEPDNRAEFCVENAKPARNVAEIKFEH